MPKLPCACCLKVSPLTDTLHGVRHSLATMKMAAAHQEAPSLKEHCSQLYACIRNGLESSLGKLKVHTHARLRMCGYEAIESAAISLTYSNNDFI